MWIALLIRELREMTKLGIRLSLFSPYFHSHTFILNIFILDDGTFFFFCSDTYNLLSNVWIFVNSLIRLLLHLLGFTTYQVFET